MRAAIATMSLVRTISSQPTRRCQFVHGMARLVPPEVAPAVA